MLTWFNKKLGAWVATWVAPAVSMEVRRELDLDKKLKDLDRSIKKKISSLDVPIKKTSKSPNATFDTFANGVLLPRVQKQELSMKLKSQPPAESVYTNLYVGTSDPAPVESD